MPIRLNLLAEAQALEELRRRDPVKRAIQGAACVGLLLLAWAGSLQFEAMMAKLNLSRMETRLASHAKDFHQVLDNQKSLAEANQKLIALHQFSTNRFLQGSLLNAMQQAALADVQLTRFHCEQTYVQSGEVKAGPGATARSAAATEKIVLSLEASDTSSPNPGDQVNQFKKAIKECPYFQNVLGVTNEPRLVSLSPLRNHRRRQVFCLVCLGMPSSGQDPMNKLTKEKRNQLIMVAGVTLLGLAALWTVLIAPLRHKLQEIAGRRAAVAHKLDEVKLAIKNADRVAAELTEARAALATVESGMASGDLYAWAINAIKEFKLSYRVEIPQFSQVDGPRDVSLLSQFPYKQASMTLGGSAYFNDFGKFLADLENQSPYIRVLNLSLEPIPSKEPVEQDKLAFKLEIVFLVKPSNA